MGFTPEPEDFDEDWAASLLGKIVLVGITFVSQSDRVVSQRQFHGRVIRVSAADGIVLSNESSGEELAIPPEPDALEAAEPGEYRLRSTGETVVDPDFTATFTVKRPVDLH